MIDAETKTCPDCGRLLPIEAFPLYSPRPGWFNRRRRCQQCINARARQRYREQNGAVKKYRQRHRPPVNGRMLDNPARIQARILAVRRAKEADVAAGGRGMLNNDRLLEVLEEL